MEILYFARKKLKYNLIFILLIFVCPFFVSGQDYIKIDSLKSQIEDADIESKIDIFNSLTLIYKRFDLDSAQFYSNNSYYLLLSVDYPKGEADYYYSMGMIYNQRSNYAVSLSHFQTALEKYKDLDDIQGICDSYTGIGDIYEYQENDSLALTYYHSALSLATNNNLKGTIAQNYNNIGAIIKNTDIDKATEYFNSAIELYKELGDNAALSSCYNNLGIMYSEIGEFEKTEEYFLRSYELKVEIQNLQGQAISLNNLAYLLLLMADNTDDNLQKEEYLYRAIDYAISSLEISESTKSLYTVRNSYGTLTQAYYKLGLFVEAMDYQSLFMEVKDSLFDVEAQKNLIELETKYQVKEQKLKIQQLENARELNRAKNLIYYLIGFGLLILISSVLVIIILRRRKDRTIFHQKEMLHIKEKRLTQIELDRKKKKEAELIKEIDFKSKQLNTHALNMVQRNQLLSELKNDIELIDIKDATKSKKQLQSLKNRLNINLNNEKEWDRFRMYFEQINKDFYDKLKVINPKLSTNDKRICALIKLNMRPSEIAQVLNIAPNSIKSARYRLKKRLGLQVTDDLEKFIQDL